jgi:SAM-dependent methyltransferase
VRTSERHSIDRVESAAAHGIDLRHRYAYKVASDYSSPTSRLLDVGCGEGYGSSLLTVAEYVGVDVDREVVERAGDRYGNERTSFVLSDGARLPFAERSFDIVTSFQVIEHVEDVATYLQEIRRVLVAGGTALFTTPNRLLRLGPAERPWNRFHLREYAPQDLYEALNGVFSVVAVYGVRGTNALEELERKRVRRARLFARLDWFGLRYRLPERHAGVVRWVLRGAHRGTNAPSTFTLDDLWHTESELENSIDLLAVATE